MNIIKKAWGGIKSKGFLSALMTVGLMMLFSFNAHAADSWADVLKEGSSTVDAAKAFVVVLAYAVGTFLFFLGLWLIYKDGKEEGRGHMKNGAIAMVIGALLLIFPTTVGWTVGSFGAESSAVQSENFNTF